MSQSTPEENTDVLSEVMKAANATIDEVDVLPDGSGFATTSMPLPDYHWLYYKPENDAYEAPPMTMRAGEDDLLRRAMTLKIREALRYALRSVTQCGQEDDFDPDALEQNLIVGLFGYFTEDGFSKTDDWANPKDSMTLEELSTHSGDRWFDKYKYPDLSKILGGCAEPVSDTASGGTGEHVD